VVGVVALSRPYAEAAPARDCWPETAWDERCQWFDALLELAQAADTAADAEPAWTQERPVYGDDLDRLATIVLNGIADYGLTDPAAADATGGPHRPKSVTFEDFAYEASKVAGRYYETEDRIGLNSRYLADPVWQRRGYLKVLTHELIHAQGYRGEVQTEAIALQVVAALGNEGEPGFRRALLEELRNDALWSAYAIAAHHTYFVADDDVRPACDTGIDVHGYTCIPVAPPNEAMLDRLNVVRQRVFDPVELSYSDYKIRWWERHEFSLLVNNYVMPPLAFTLTAYCRSPHTLPDSPSWQRTIDGQPVPATLPADEGNYVLASTGWQCPSWW